MKLGVITYDYSHLKTEQLVCKYIQNKNIESIELFALPFKKRKTRQVLFSHRPEMGKGITTRNLAELDKVTFSNFDGKEKIGKDCDFFVIGGAGIIDIEFANNKPIVNAHPGIIPTCRGLDSFKWAILNGDPLGITLHLIDAEVDKGKTLIIEKTPLFSSDTLNTLARRHYELEIDLLANIPEIIKNPQNYNYLEKPATKRMNYELEKVMFERFSYWKEKFINKP